MHDKPKGAGDDERAPTTAQDHQDQAAVLTIVMELHPANMTVAELVCEVTAGSADFEPQDRCRRAIRDLAAAGLLHRCGDLIFPSRAALLFSILDRD